MKKHCNIPVFVPHLGCPHACVFCDQRAISGHGDLSLEKAREEIGRILSSLSPDTEREIAFFGGSFTCIERERMLALCRLGREYIQSGAVSALRCSTRPDGIDGETLSVLKEYGFSTVELGVQSVSDPVLAACRRGHTFADTERACRLVRAAGLSLVGQMMIGLPAADPASELATARFLSSAGASAVRVYPTVVFSGTALAADTASGRYQPLSTEEAIERTAAVLDVFDRAGVPVIRVGLCEGEGLRAAAAGPNDPALGERAMSRLFLRRAREALDPLAPAGRDLAIEVPRGALSRMIGRHRENLFALKRIYNAKNVKVIENPFLKEYNIQVKII
ncbi:MAG: radical SAM protein [Clostridia bacterium]|nr:radical SAM protein [Clostridia bacterium]